jgi:plasmid stability protein
VGVVAPVFIVVHNAYMSKDAAVTVRIPNQLKRQLEVQARRERRSLSAQVVTYLEQAVASHAPPSRSAPAAFLGRYAGMRLPNDSDFAEVRAMLWGSLGQDRERRGS